MAGRASAGAALGAGAAGAAVDLELGVVALDAVGDDALDLRNADAGILDPDADLACACVTLGGGGGILPSCCSLAFLNDPARLRRIRLMNLLMAISWVLACFSH